jgi:hypothetical protein
MKKFSIFFLIGLVAFAGTGNLIGALVCFIGLFFTENSYRLLGYAGLQTVPGKYVITDPISGLLQEVPFMSRAEKALYDQLITLGRSNPVTAKAIDEGGISFDPTTYYIRYNITGLANSVKFVSAATMRLPGITNFPNGATLAQYYNFCFDRVAVRTALTNTANTAVGAVTQWTGVSASVDPAVRNGEFAVRSNRNLIVETPVIDFLSAAAVTGGGSREFDGGILEKPRFFLELLQIESELTLAGTVSSAANTTVWLEVAYMGVQARLKA